MASAHALLSRIEAALLGPAPPSPSQRIDLLHSIRASLPSFRSLLSYPEPKESDRTQVRSRKVSFPNKPPLTLDDTDVEIALKLSDDLHLNEIDCVQLLVLANTEWALTGRDKLERYRLAAGLWYMERRDLITSLYILLRSVVLDQGLDPDLVAEIQKHIEDLFNSALRTRLISLIRGLNREESAGFGRQNSEKYVMDIRGTLIERKAIVYRERLSLSHCLALSVLVSQISPKDIKDVFLTLKECAAEINENTGVTELQIIFALMFSVIISLISDALRTSLLSSDSSFRNDFHQLVMTVGTNPNVEGFIGAVRLAWSVHLMLTQDRNISTENIINISSFSLRETERISSCLELISSQNSFQFLLTNVIRTSAFKNDDEDMVYVYGGYLHKMMCGFLSHPISRDKVKEMKDKAMSAQNPYISSDLDDFNEDSVSVAQPFVSLLELISEIYQKEPEMLHGNEEIWSFINLAGEDHTSIQTLVSFLRLLSSLAWDEEGAARVYELLQGRTFRSVGWSTLFDCLTVYDERFKHAFQSGSVSALPVFPKPEAQALVAYLSILKKVVENGNPIERKKWFPDIEPLFKLLGYENVPPFLKGALRSCIGAFIKVSPFIKDAIWSYLEQYELPVISSPQNNTKNYDMRYELNEVEARMERYPSTISYLNLLNALIREETDLSDRGHRFMGIYKFVHDHVFAPFPQRAYADSCEKWELVLACLEHFILILSFDVIKDENVANSTLEIPAIELMKDLMSGREAFRNIMSVLLIGVNTLIDERSSKVYGQILEKVVHLSLEIILLATHQDLSLADTWRPLYQPLDVILAQDPKQTVALLEYVRYDVLPDIQRCSIKLMRILSARMVGLVQILIKSGSAKSLIEDYAMYLEFRFDETQINENPKDDIGVLILQLLIENISRPMPNISHLLLSFDVNNRIERTKLQPKFYYSCLKVIFENLEKLSKPDINAMLHELSFQLLYELCVDPLTTGPITDILSSKRYQFFSKHIDTIGDAPIPKGIQTQTLRVSTLHQRSWLLKLLALELHVADVSVPSHHETCLAIISDCFSLNNNKLLELLQLVRFRSSDADLKYPQILSGTKYEQKVQEILSFAETTEQGGVYYYSERGDRLIEIDSLQTQLLQMMEEMGINNLHESEKNEFRELTHKLVRWAVLYNKIVEEQTAQLHLLTGWSQLVEVGVSRRMPLIGDHSQILFELLDASLSMTASSDCSKKMAIILTNVALTCMAKLRDERFASREGAESADSVTCLDIILSKNLPAGAFHSILVKLIMALLRSESSEPLRRRQYALLLSYFKYCESMLDPEVPHSVIRYLLSDEQTDDFDDFHLQKIDKEQNELARANFSIIKKEAQSIIDLITKDATQGSEAMKPISFYVLDVLIQIDTDKFFLNQIQSRGLLRSVLSDLTKFSLKSGPFSFESMQKLCTIEAQISLLVKICHKYGKYGAQILQSMGAIDHLSTCRLDDLSNTGDLKWNKERSEKQRFILVPILRLVSCIASLASSSDYAEAKNKILREVLDFVRSHNLIFSQKLRQDLQTEDESILEQVYLAVFILCKVWPYDENDEYRFSEELFKKMIFIFNRDVSSTNLMQSSDLPENGKKSELVMYKLCFSLISYLYYLVRNNEIQLQVHESNSKPSLETILTLLNSVCIVMERIGEEKFVLLNKVQNINELSRQEVDDIIKSFSIQDHYTSPHDNIRKRRYVAMREMCQMAGERDQLLSLLLQIAESALHILLLNLQDPQGFDQNDLSMFCGRLHPVLERLEHLNEEKVGQNLKLFRRSLSTLKEMSIRNMAL